MIRPRFVVGVAFLAAQVVAIGYGRVGPSRYFAWAPYDAITLYSLEVRIGDEALNTEGAARRYRLDSPGRDNRAIQHVIDAIRQYEQTYGAGDRADVLMRYRTNGGPERTWRWPER